MRNLNALAVFATVAETRSFSAGGLRLGISASGASRAVSRLESDLGVRLLARTTRSVRLTEEGAAYLERCRRILDEITDAENAITSDRARPQGKLRLHVPVGFGKKIIVPALHAFRERYPEITLDVELNDRVPDLAQGGIDVSVRVGELSDTHIVARRLCRTRFITVAAPSYLKSRGTPRTPEELAGHDCLAYAIPGTGRYRAWEFAKDGRKFSVAVAGKLNMNNGEALVDAAIAGAGIATVASFVAADAIGNGRLRLILKDYMADGPTIYVTYLNPKQAPARVRAMVDFLSEILPADPPWERVGFSGRAG